jgi:hypothetical protein
MLLQIVPYLPTYLRNLQTTRRPRKKIARHATLALFGRVGDCFDKEDLEKVAMTRPMSTVALLIKIV